MNKENQKTALSGVERVVPELRFPEFENDTKWNRKTIAELVKDNTLFPQKDGNHGNIHPKSSDFVNKGIPFIMASDIRNGKINYSKCKHISKKQADNLQKGFAKEEDVLLTHKGTVGEVAIIRKNEFPYLMLTPQVTYYRIKKKNKLSNEFLRSFFLCDDFQKKILDASGGGTRAYVGITAQGNLSINLPPTLLEQQKIANCLSSLDNLITAEIEKLDHFKDHKKGLLQQLFPAKGETKPQFRFPEFKDDGDWEVEPFNDVYSFKITNSFSRDKLNYEKGKVKNIHYGDIHTKFSSHFDITKENVPYINLDISIDRINKDNYCKEGDLVIADASEDIDDIGKSIEIVNLNQEQILAGLHTFLARPIDDKIKLGFGGHLFKSNGIITQIKKEAQGAKVLGISKGRIANLDVYYPKDLKEQQKIANCLSSADDLIQEQTTKIETLKAHKKGLMQQLFPNSI